MRDWQLKLANGEYIREFRGYAPGNAGCFYGDSNTLGGEEAYRHCYDFFSGVCEVDWWIVEELNKHSEAELNELEFICARNKWVNDKIVTLNVVNIIVKILGCPSHSVHRLGNRIVYEYIRTKLTKYVTYSHIKLPKIEDITWDDIKNIDLSKDTSLALPKNINGIALDPIITMSDINEGIAYVPSDILDILPTLQLINTERDGIRLSLIKAKTNDQSWLDSWNIE